MKNETETFVCLKVQYQIGTETTRRDYMMMFYLNIVVGAAGIVLNTLVLISIVSRKRKRLPSWTLLIVLTVINLSQGLLVQPISSANSYLMSTDRPLCQLTLADGYFSLIIGKIDLLTIFMVNIQFYLAIVKPFFFKTKFNQIGYLIVLYFSWVVFGIVTVVSYLYRDFRSIFIVSVGISGVCIYLIMCGIYFLVSKEVNNMLKKVSTNNESLSLKASLKKTRILASSALIAYTVSVLPVAIFSLLKEVVWQIGFWLALLLKLNAILDPVVYCIRMSVIRKPILHLLKRCVK